MYLTTSYCCNFGFIIFIDFLLFQENRADVYRVNSYSTNMLPVAGATEVYSRLNSCCLLADVQMSCCITHVNLYFPLLPFYRFFFQPIDLQILPLFPVDNKPTNLPYHRYLLISEYYLYCLFCVSKKWIYSSKINCACIISVDDNIERIIFASQ